MVWEGRHREVPPYPDQWRLFRFRNNAHTAASQAVMVGENLPLVGKLLGHRRHRTTAGYAHLADAYLVEAAERIGRVIADAMKEADIELEH